MDFLIEEGYIFDAIITDPPYAITGFSWDKIIDFDEMWKKLEKLIKPTGAIVLFGNEPFSSNLRKSNEKMYKYDWKWVKTQVTGFQNSKYQPLRCYEDIMVFSKAGAVPTAGSIMCYYPQGLVSLNIKNHKDGINYLKDAKARKKEYYIQEYGNFPRNVIQFARENKPLHPTQKPCSLMEYLIQTYTKEGELVLDFTSGSGSTLVSCEKLNRRWVGIELTEKYCKITKERLKKGIQLKIQFNYEE